ncbi:MAG: hypothetical protein BWY01_01755 [Synergistetes bacterium ADurb.Bin155]|nr:MAG: hypothetical protein BWY01_01755 [Synergistetes bacterium ADurb.Bin155]
MNWVWDSISSVPASWAVWPYTKEPFSRFIQPAPRLVKRLKPCTWAEKGAAWVGMSMLTRRLEVSSPIRVWEPARTVPSSRVASLLVRAVRALPWALSRTPVLTRLLFSSSRTASESRPVATMAPSLKALEKASAYMPWAFSPSVATVPDPRLWTSPLPEARMPWEPSPAVSTSPSLKALALCAAYMPKALPPLVTTLPVLTARELNSAAMPWEPSPQVLTTPPLKLPTKESSMAYMPMEPGPWVTTLPVLTALEWSSATMP